MALILIINENTEDDYITGIENTRFDPSILTTLYYNDSKTR